MRTAVDTNVISALWSGEAAADGMQALLFDASRQGALVVAAPVHAELLAYPGATPPFVDGFLHDTGIRVDFALSEAVWRRAGEAFAAYAERRRGDRAGPLRRLLVDFLVGAHARLDADRLLTLDARRYRTDFPELSIAPDPP